MKDIGVLFVCVCVCVKWCFT